MVHLGGTPQLAAVHVCGALPVHRPVPLEGKHTQLPGVRPCSHSPVSVTEQIYMAQYGRLETDNIMVAENILRFLCDLDQLFKSLLKLLS